jgi:hypothetical protein
MRNTPRFWTPGLRHAPSCRALCCALWAALVIAPAGLGAAQAHREIPSGDRLRLGVADYGQYGLRDVTRLLGTANGLRLGAVRLTMEWSPGETRLSQVQRDVVREASSFPRLVTIYTLAFDRGRDAPTTRRSRHEFAAWASDLVRAGARVVEATNEPMEPLFWNSADPPRDYARLLVLLYSTLHRQSPGVTLIAGSLARHHSRIFMAQLTRTVAGRRVADAVSLHYPRSAADYDLRVGLLHRCFGAGLPVYVTEDGSNLRDEAAQAAQTATKIELAESKQAAAWVLLQLQDRADLYPWHTGVFLGDWGRKPSFYVLRKAAVALESDGRTLLRRPS